ncbi:MAG: hypothetical protein Q9228_006387 [Teloschistes exilis]
MKRFGLRALKWPFTSKEVDLQVQALEQYLVLSALEDEPDIGQSASLRDQYEKLLIQPLRRMAPLPVKHDPLCIVIDALDECDEQHDLRMLLRLMAETDDIPTLGLKILVTSRPELQIRRGFKKISTIFHRDLALQDVPQAVVNTDIMTFLKHELKEIQYDFQLPADWPTPDDMNTLLRKAGGLFIFAATSCRYMGGSPQAKPQDRLKQVCASVAPNKLMTNELDQMYTIVLQNSIKGSYTEEEREASGASFRYVVGCMILLFDPLPLAELFRLLQDPHIDSEEELEGVLRTLHAVIGIPRDTGCPVQILHLSFHDYLLGSNRCLDPLFWVDEKKTHRIQAGNCLRLLKSTLYRNMCGLPSFGTLRKDVDPLTIRNTFPPGVEYACRHWVEHALRGELVVADNGDVHELLQRHFLHWLECMSLMGRISEAIVAMNSLAAMTECRDKTNRVLFLPDAKMLATLTYSWDSWERFRPFKQLDLWDVQTGNCQSHLKPSIADLFMENISPDGNLVGQLTKDGTLMLWDIARQEYRFTIEPGPISVSSAEFSDDGQSLALGFKDGAISLLHTQTGNQQSKLDGHSRRITDLIFSPDGKLMVSIAKDEPTRVWNIRTASQLVPKQVSAAKATFSSDSSLPALRAGTLPGPEVERNKSMEAGEVSFLPNGALVASTDSAKVRIYDSDTGKCRFEYDGHSVSLSPDGFTVVSIFNDVIRLLDTETGHQRCFQGGRLPVISPDGQQAAFVSNDRSIRLWGIQDSTSLFIFKGHSQEISSLVFSQNEKGNSVFTFPSYFLEGDFSRNFEKEIMAFAPSSELLVLGCTKGVQLWDLPAGRHRFDFNFKEYILDIVFSSDDPLVAFAFVMPRMVRLSNTNTGEHVLTISCSSSIPRVEFVTGVDAIFVNGQAHEIRSGE